MEERAVVRLDLQEKGQRSGWFRVLRELLRGHR